jgi:lipopolysaccharide transport system permease protein
MSSEQKSLAEEITVLKPPSGWAALNLRDLWVYRELVYFLTWRDIKVRYKQAVLGVAWAILQPLFTMVVFSVILGNFLGVPTDGNVPYPIFSYVAILPWQLFASTLQRSGTSLVSSANLLKKVYFPRLVIPIASMGAGLVDFFISFLVLLGLMAYYHITLSWQMLWIIPLILLAILTALSIGLWLSALNVQYRDIQQMLPFIIQAWFYISPVVYSSNIVPSEKWRMVYALNPMAGVINGFRWALLGTQQPDASIFISAGVVLVLLVSGLFFFKRMEYTFADIV